MLVGASGSPAYTGQFAIATPISFGAMTAADYAQGTLHRDRVHTGGSARERRQSLEFTAAHRHR